MENIHSLVQIICIFDNLGTHEHYIVDGMRAVAVPLLFWFVVPCSAVRSVVLASPRGPNDEAAERAAAIECAAAILRQDGVVMIRCDDLERLAPPAENAQRILASMIARIDRAGLDHNQPFSFAEICHRAPRRYDVHLGDGKSGSEFSTLFNSLVQPVLQSCARGARATATDDGAVAAARIRIIRDGLVTSLPGASAQPFHADGRAQGLYNAFLPLVPVRTQGTEFWLGSHNDEGAALRLKRDETGEYVGESLLDDAEIHQQISAPVLTRAEGILLFDYRVIHRGRAHGAHEAEPRPVFYRVYGINEAAEDVHNWPERRLPA